MHSIIWLGKKEEVNEKVREVVEYLLIFGFQPHTLSTYL
jgi:hypothetical protein